MLSPENALLNIFPRPLPFVSMSMLEDIQTMDPFSVIICSPLLRVQVTTGKLPPLISYFMLHFLLYNISQSGKFFQIQCFSPDTASFSEFLYRSSNDFLRKIQLS